MTDDTATDTARPRRPLLGVTLLLGGVAAVAWWRQARRDAALVERTRDRLISRPVEAAVSHAEPANVLTHPDLLPHPDPVVLRLASEPKPLSGPTLNPVESPTAIPSPAPPPSTEPFSPDLRGLKVG